MPLSKPSSHGRLAERILQEAVLEVYERNQKLGWPVVVFYKGKTVTMSAKKALQLARQKMRGFHVKKKQFLKKNAAATALNIRPL